MPADRVTDLQWALADMAERLPVYKQMRAYYQGDQPIIFGNRKLRTQFAQMVKRFRLNLMPSVVAAPADRLALSGWDDGDSEGAGDSSSRMDELWKQAQGPRAHGIITRSSLIHGDSYALVWPDSGPERRLWPQRADLMTVRYDPADPDSIELAGKVWRDQAGYLRVNLYYPDRVERFRTRQPRTRVDGRQDDEWNVRDVNPRDLEPHADDDGDAEIGHGFGEVPVSHFPHDPLDVAEHGRSALRDVVPLQDALNKAVVDMLVAMERYALPLRYATGFDPDDPAVDGEDSGGEHEAQIQPDDWFVAFPGAQTQVGQLPQADLGKIVEVQDAIKVDIARVTGIPLHYFMLQTSQLPSGESLRVANQRLTSQVRSIQDDWTPPYARVARLLGAEAQPLWEDPEPRSPKDDAEAAQARQDAGVSRRQSLREIGYTDAQIDEMGDERAADEQRLGREMRRAAMNGGDPAAMFAG